MIVAGTKNLALVWHRKRPHLYQYVFRGHKDVVTAIEWDNTFNYLITGSKDKRVVIQEIAGGYRPHANLNTTAIDFNVYEDLAQVDDIIGTRDPERFLKDLDGGSVGGGKRSQRDATTRHPLSGAVEVQPMISVHRENNNVSNFEYFSENYVWHSFPVDTMCALNAEVARDVGLEDLAMTWDSLEKLYHEYVASLP